MTDPKCFLFHSYTPWSFRTRTVKGKTTHFRVRCCKRCGHIQKKPIQTVDNLGSTT